MKLAKFSGRASTYLLAIFGLCLSLSAQERFSDINGTVKDATGAVMPGVKISVQNVVSKRSYELQTGSDGTYLGLNLDPARYDVIFSRQGFTTQKAENVDLLVGKATTINVSLQVGNTADSVTVSEAIGQIDFSSTKIATNVTADEFDRLPKGRSFQTLAVQATSVNQGTIEGGIQINGASGAENQFNIDGVSVTSAINGQQRQNALYEALAEVQVKTGGLDAEYGGAMGGTISAITKSGGNQFHGDLHYYLSGNSLSAGPVKRLQLNTTTERDGANFQDTKFKDTNNEIGGSLGGPLVKNKLYFYTLFSPRFRRESNDYVFANGPDSIKRAQTYHAWFNKLSWDVTSKLRANFTYYWSPTRSEGRLLAYNGFCANCST